VSVSENHVGEELNREEARRLLGPFGFHASQKAEVFAAFKENPEGVERCALRAKAAGQREGRSGAGLLLAMIRNGEHQLKPDLDAPKITNWRWVRANNGSGGTYVPDPAGTDTLPHGYDFHTRNPVVAAAERLEEHTSEEREEIARLMRGWVTERFGDKQEIADPTADLREAESGRCDDCGDTARLRWELGKFTLCGSCVVSRKRAGLRVGMSA
jgi:hypothetical protein